MKLALKAYKCTFPAIGDYTSELWEDENQYRVIFGKSQKEAVKKVCSEGDGFTYWELKEHARTRRFKEKDLYSQEKSSLLTFLSDEEINHLTHSLGINTGDKCPDEFYRNYSMYYKKNRSCELLVGAGLMENWQKNGSEIYAVTEKGIEAVKTLLLVNIVK